MATITTDDLRQVQKSNDVVTPRQAVEIVQASGRDATSRTVSFFQTQNLLPTSDRVGSRGGQLPAIVVDLIVMILDMRTRGVRIGAIRELLPLWSCLVAGQVRGCVDLSLFEQVARGHKMSDDAILNVPALVEHVLGGVAEARISGTSIALKDGQIVEPTEALTLKFAYGALDPETNTPQIRGWSQLTLPSVRDEPLLTDPATVILGLPLDVAVSELPTAVMAVQKPTRARRPRHRQTEELPLTYA